MGIDIEEFDFSFMRLLKKENVEEPFEAFIVLDSPNDGGADV